MKRFTTVMKRTLCTLLAICTAVTLCSCDNNNAGEVTTTKSNGDTTTAATDKNGDTTTANPQTHLSANGITTVDDGKIRAELTALEVADLMGNGINLGNTMEAYGHNSMGVEANPNAYEILWGQPVTTQEMITAMKDSGFDSLRIPVAWTNMMDYENGDYTINEAYLNRVEEIINYARNAGMYVIINDHWDGSWWGMFGSATEQTRKNAWELYTSMWTQIAERYKEYSDFLIFESANEELGDRLNDKDVASDSGTLSKADCYKLTTEINQKFVDIVRGTGGNNAQRFLLIAGYNTDITLTAANQYVMPTDTAKNKLLISVHYYTPWDYCGTESVTHWGSVTEYNEQNRLLKLMEKFTEQGYGVIIGEYAVALDGSEVKKNTADFIENFLNNCDLYGYVPMLWDCSSLFKRNTLKWIAEDVEQLFKERSYSAQSGKTAEQIKTDAKAALDAAVKKAEETQAAANPLTANPDATIAWIMMNTGDYKASYSVGDTYDPTAISDGVVATDATLNGEGTYTVALDFTASKKGYASGIAFSAIGITNGERINPGYVIDIKSVLINGEEYTLVAKPYTSSDNGQTTRVNLYNAWISGVPDGARTIDGSTEGCSPQVIDGKNVGMIKTISITFDYVKK